ncbi:hypothetical protein PsorP6_015938 [Peronosclerospora sorghi]|uniref:Uncharacterized protein n=1 Tax=Peronosclerospora sorghi TaxID=230839 RepID=A0ACC0WMI9_9STRA|nr:hypothetical protein PsorP6_015938 [Peronosclerospora sorghi]
MFVPPITPVNQHVVVLAEQVTEAVATGCSCKWLKINIQRLGTAASDAAVDGQWVVGPTEPHASILSISHDTFEPLSEALAPLVDSFNFNTPSSIYILLHVGVPSEINSSLAHVVVPVNEVVACTRTSLWTHTKASSVRQALRDFSHSFHEASTEHRARATSKKGVMSPFQLHSKSVPFAPLDSNQCRLRRLIEGNEPRSSAVGDRMR